MHTTSFRIEQRRGDRTESVHHVHVAVVDATGALVAHAGDPDLVTFWRSAAKPFQALPIVADGAAEHFGLDVRHLAIACASHSSEPAQVELVREFLARIGAAESDLQCGPHTPLSDAVARNYRARGVELTAVYSNCSGKHTGMLALARFHGWPTADYHRLQHPVQQRCLREVSRWTDLTEGAIGTAVDGCGVVCYALPVRRMALAYARLANATVIPQAMVEHPELIAGEGRPCTEMMRAFPGRVITKVGAEGVYSGVLLRERLGVSLKVEDGHGLAAALAMASVLGQLGLSPQPDSLQSRTNFNTRGEAVGELRVFGALER
ncbi:MAG TPA: asparaginase [Gemmatimonadales bacterium]|nr:asparaginase [Gemmatimonadales bacterium]